MNGGVQQGPMFPSLDSLEVVLWPGFALIVFVVTAFIVDVMIILSTRFRLVDLPNKRSAHALPTARGAGIAFVLTTFLASCVAAYRWPDLAFRILVGVMTPSLVIAVVGFIDDIRPLRAVLRLFIQIGVAVFMTAVLGPLPAVELPGLPALGLGHLAWPLTVLWIVGLINAFNFMDGADGMAGLGAVIVGLSMAAVGYRIGALAPMLLASFTAAAVGGFLVFNWQPARVFMGDVGSGFLGAVFAAITILVSDELIVQAFVPMAMALWPYVYDPFVGVLRRLWNGKNPLVPHREFFFHRLVRSGVSHATAALLYGALSAAGGIVGVAMVSPGIPAEVRVWLPAVVVVLAAALTLGIEDRCRRVPLEPVGEAAPVKPTGSAA
jgi:UDP-N-acetylmuramyl pentapeptide phosphotransferase/UDP-N-acetylglucosamine-1-phosphate transferase